MQEENLSEMIKSGEERPAIFSEEDLSLPEGSIEESETTVEAATPTVESISIASLNEWFSANADTFPNINEVKVAIRGVDPSKTLIMAVENESEDTDADGNPMRDLRIFENADNTPVLDITPERMEVYNKGFQIVYDYDEDVAIKCYGVTNGLIAIFCNKIEGRLVPYSITRLKRKDTDLEVIRRDVSEVLPKMDEATDFETLHILYKQSNKAGDLNTNKDAINWLIERQSTVTDINHLLQIDNVIISLLT